MDKNTERKAKDNGIPTAMNFKVVERQDDGTEKPFNFETGEYETEESEETEEELDNLVDEQEEDELYSSVAVQKYWEERWENLNEIERAMFKHEYIKEKFKLNDFGIYCYVQDYIIKHHGVDGLLTDIEKIMTNRAERKNKDPKRILEDIKTRWLTNLLNELVEENDKNKPYAVQIAKFYSEKVKPLLTKVVSGE